MNNWEILSNELGLAKKISQCSYYNLFNFKLTLGTDVCPYVEQEKELNCEKECELSKLTIDYNPEFPETKQFELVKYLQVDIKKKGKEYVITKDIYSGTNEDFSEALAELTLKLIHYEKENKETIKGLL